jgi:hypothetical protein
MMVVDDGWGGWLRRMVVEEDGWDQLINVLNKNSLADTYIVLFS